MAEWYWYSSHFMEYARGSSAINEWFVQALSIASGYMIDYQNTHWPQQSIDQIALGLPNLNRFIAEFTSNIKLVQHNWF